MVSFFRRKRRKNSTPPEVKPASSDFFTKETPQQPPPSTSEVNKAKILNTVRGFGANWSEDVEKALDVPDKLYYMRNMGTIMFSKEPEFAIADVINGLEVGGLETPKTDYGIAIYEEAATSYLVLVDMNRRIIVRDLRMSLYDTAQIKDWQYFVGAVSKAEKAANENPNSIVICDGLFIRFLKLERPSQKRRKEDRKDYSNSMTKKGCLVSLRMLAPVPEDFGLLLDIPERLYWIAEESFSSDPFRGIGKMANALAEGAEISNEMISNSPDYALHISYRGNSVFCTLLDKKRKILVVGSLGNMRSGLYWDEFIGSMKVALEEVMMRDSKGEKFDILVKLESGIRTLKLH